MFGMTVKWIVLVQPERMGEVQRRLEELKCGVMGRSIPINDKLALSVDGPQDLPTKLAGLAEVCTGDNVTVLQGRWNQ
jgi:hypothetical protein